MKLPVKVSDETIMHVLDDAGSAIQYWASHADRKDDYVLYVKVHPSLLPAGEAPKWHRVGVRRALETMAAKCPAQFGRMLSGDYDATTCDLFVQYGCFGELVYS
jgi:hypothetical protein